MDKKWNILGKYEKNSDLVEYLLKLRGIKDTDVFLNPPNIKEYYTSFASSFKNSLKLGKKMVMKCIDENMPIIIYGDYDSDGVNATAILYSTIHNELGYSEVSWFIPNRFKHGYGLSRSALKEILKDLSGPVLFITVDTGITGVEEIKYLKSLGHKVIVTDHHQKLDGGIDADVVIWNDTVVGAMVAWFFSKALGSQNNKSLSLGAIATITDLFPVVDINRSIVKTGLEILNNDPIIGIRKLLDVAGKKGEITTYDLGWVVGPRLNAAGRLIDAGVAVDLLLAENEDIASDLASKLNSVNIDRQDKTVEMYDLVPINEDNLPKIIIVAHADYHDGIIGLVASRLTQKYYRPSIVISLEDGVGKGSVRSVAGIDIISLLRKYDDLFIDLGGHPMAAGFSIEKDKIKLLESKLLEEDIDESLLVPVLHIDLEIPISLINLELVESLEKLKPFGLGNEKPVFMSAGVRVVDTNVVGREGNHLVIRLSDGSGFYKAIWFNGVGNIDLSMGDVISVVYSLNKNEYNDKTYIDLIVKDIKKLN